MEPVFKYFNKDDINLFKYLKEQIQNRYKIIRKITKDEKKYTKDKLLQIKKYKINLFRQIEYLKDDIYSLKIEKILEKFFYEKKIINHTNIKSLNKDVLQVINDFNFGGTEYLYYKQTGEDFYHITTHLENIKNLLKEGWIEKIYKGNYTGMLITEQLKEKCELVFDKITFYFKPINLLNIRKSDHGIYIGFFNININGEEKYIEKIFNDLCDFDNFEKEILSKKIVIKSLEVKIINNINIDHIYCSYCFSIDKKTNKLHKPSIMSNLFEKQLIKLLSNL